MSATFEIQGFAELERELQTLGKSVGKAVLRRTAKKALQPMADIMKAAAPRGDTARDNLAESIAVSPKLSKRQASAHRKMFRDDKATIEMHAGPGPDPAAWNQEFGNVNHGPQPFVRPAWDQDKMALLDRVKAELRSEIDKAVARAERRARRATGG